MKSTLVWGKPYVLEHKGNATVLTNLRTNWFPCSLSQNTIGGLPFYTSFLHHSWKLQHKVISGQVKGPYLKNIYDCAMITVFNGPIWDFLKLIETSVPTKRLSQNFPFGDLRSDQFCNRTIMRLWLWCYETAKNRDSFSKFGICIAQGCGADDF